MNDQDRTDPLVSAINRCVRLVRPNSFSETRLVPDDYSDPKTWQAQIGSRCTGRRSTALEACEVMAVEVHAEILKFEADVRAARVQIEMLIRKQLAVSSLKDEEDDDEVLGVCMHCGDPCDDDKADCGTCTSGS